MPPTQRRREIRRGLRPLRPWGNAPFRGDKQDFSDKQRDSRYGCLFAVLSGTPMERYSGNADCIYLRRNAHRHDTVVQNSYPVISLKTADAVGTHQNLLRSRTVTHQQTIPVDLQYDSTHDCHCHHLTSVHRKHRFPDISLCSPGDFVKKHCPVYVGAQTGQRFLSFRWQYISFQVLPSLFWESPAAARHRQTSP